MDETEYAFVPCIKWPDFYEFEVTNEHFWNEIEENYDTYIAVKRKTMITVADLKIMIEECA